MAENPTEGCLFSDTDTTIFQLSKKHTQVCVMILWQTFADYLFAGDDICANLALFQKNFKFLRKLKHTVIQKD